MGLAASQARFLGLTARKTNTEYSGQQINQQRTALANESAGLFNDMLALKVVTPPQVDDYYNINYTFTDPSDTTKTKQVASWTADTNTGTGYILTYTDGTTATASALEFADGILKKVTFGSNSPTVVTPKRVYDDAAYSAKFKDYTWQKDLYDKAISDINAKTEKIQVQDRTLELKLKQLDSEQQALSTELESVKKVIDKNIDATFKTFA